MQEPGLPPAVQQEADMEKWIWTSQKPWIPRPLLSVHVRLGDKGSEMKLMGFDAYMALAIRLRLRFPQVQNIWLSSEMQVFFMQIQILLRALLSIALSLP